MDEAKENLDKTKPERTGLQVDTAMKSHSAARIPLYFLYGQPPHNVADDFLHLEDLDERSRPGNWTIRSHAHTALAHLFVITEGGGSMSADAASYEFAAPGLLLVPAGVVHAFRWQADTRGRVLTISVAFLARLLAATPELAGLFDTSRHIALLPGPGGMDPASHTLDRLGRELAWSAPGRARALDSGLITLLLDAWRLSAVGVPPNRQTPKAPARLAERFIAAVEGNFRALHTISFYAEALGTQPEALRAAVRAATGRPPATMLRERRILEAKRLLLYANVSVAEAAYSLGFEDPAYFSRVFSKSTGLSPRAFRGSRNVG